MRTSDPRRRDLNVVVGVAALVAPALHSVTDVMEWYQHGFSAVQLWLNYIAFLPMPWLLLGLYAVHDPRPNAVGLAGALLYGVAFTYFAHTTLYAIAEHAPSYEALWSRLGSLYTLHGAFMVLGGIMFAWAALRQGWLPRSALLLFGAGIVWNLVLAMLPAPTSFRRSEAQPATAGSWRWVMQSWSTPRESPDPSSRGGRSRNATERR